MDSFSPRYRNPFPKLTELNHRSTSPAVPSYNCFGWAIAGEEILIGWQPGYQWPSNVPRNAKLESFQLLVAAYGWESCANGDQESGFEKLALYGAVDRVDHAARQQKNGRWTSKRGLLHDDIEHDTVDCISGGEYGPSIAFFKRPVQING